PASSTVSPRPVRGHTARIPRAVELKDQNEVVVLGSESYGGLGDGRNLSLARVRCRVRHRSHGHGYRAVLVGGVGRKFPRLYRGIRTGGAPHFPFFFMGEREPGFVSGGSAAPLAIESTPEP